MHPGTRDDQLSQPVDADADTFYRFPSVALPPLAGAGHRMPSPGAFLLRGMTMTDTDPPHFFYEIHLTPAAVTFTEAVLLRTVPVDQVESFHRLLDQRSGDFRASTDFLDLRHLTIDWTPTTDHAAVAVLTLGAHHLTTLGLFRSADDDTDLEAVDHFHEGLAYLAHRFETKRRMPAHRLPTLRPAVFCVLMTDAGIEPPPTIHKAIRALAVAFFLRGTDHQATP